MDDIWVEAYMTENNLANVGAGNKVELAFDAFPRQIFEGKVRSVGIGVSTAILCAWVAFLLIPALPAPPDPHHHGGMDTSQAAALAGTMTVVVAPLLIAFLLFGWTDILILIYATLIATALSNESSAEMGWEKVVANLVFVCGSHRSVRDRGLAGFGLEWQ